MPVREKKVRGFLRNYRSEPVKDRHQEAHWPYTGRLHHERADYVVDWDEKIQAILDVIPEGEVVEIVVRRLGRSSPLADDPWVLLSPHTYGPNSKAKRGRK